jgi:uncharacterized damage-inducible protein DinB
MNDLTEGIRVLLVRELKTFATEIEMFPDDESIWKTLPGVTNSAGTLARHVCGNLQHFVGRVLGGTTYTRNREAEFGEPSGTRATLIEEIERTIDVVNHVLPQINDEALLGTYPQQLGGMTFRTDRFLLHLVAHLAHHLGQAGYLRRIVTADHRSSGPVPLPPLAVVG